MIPRWPVVLASASPRRKELLGQVFSTFEVLPSDVDEASMTVADPWETAQILARAKALDVARNKSGSLVIGSDTVVALKTDGGWIQLAKPVDPDDALRMLAMLSGRTHHVITGVSLHWPGGEVGGSETTEVSFRAMMASEINAYVATGEPMDKAGAYAVQGGAAEFVRAIEGSITNVIGLPLELLSKLLLENGLAELDPSHCG